MKRGRWLQLASLVAVLIVVGIIALVWKPGQSAPTSQQSNTASQTGGAPTASANGGATVLVASKYPYNQPTNIKFPQADIDTAWHEWKAAMITAQNAGAAPRLRVMGGVDMQSTTSEGQGYGMMFASVLDDQATLDGLWLFTADYLDKHGLMDWHIAADRTRAGTGGATDADEDIAMALVNACTKVRQGVWPASPNHIDYCSAASSMIKAIYNYEVDTPG